MEFDLHKIKLVLNQDRKRRDISQTKQANLIGISQSQLNKFGNNYRGMGCQVLLKVCRYLKVTPDFFLIVGSELRQRDLPLEESQGLVKSKK